MRPIETRALLFDLDGTVADSHELIYRCLDETARELLNVSFPRSLWEEHVGTPLADLFSLVCVGPPSEIMTLVDHYRARQLSLEHVIRPFPGMEPVLSTLREKGVRLAIVTTKMRDVAARHVDAIGFATHFDAIIGFDDCTRAKPDAEPFLRAAQALEVEPSAAAGVGDSVVDIHGARAAGMMSIAALWGTVSRDAVLAANPDHIVHDPAELLHLLI